MKKILLLLSLFLNLSFLQAQYEQIKGQPCYMEKYLMGQCSAEAPDIERHMFEADGVFLILDKSQDTILTIEDYYIDTISLSLAETHNYYFFGDVCLGEKYNGTTIGYDTSPNDSFKIFSSDLIQSDQGTPITKPSQIPIHITSYSYSEELFTQHIFITNKETQESFSLILTKFSKGNEKAVLFEYVILTNFKPLVCTPADLEFQFSDSLFYDIRGKLTKRKRNNSENGEAFDLIQLYSFTDDDKLTYYAQINKYGDTTKIEKRYYDEEGRIYKTENIANGFFQQSKTTIIVSYSLSGHLSEITETIIDLSDNEIIRENKEVFKFNSNGNWENYVTTNAVGDTIAHVFSTDFLGNNTYKFTDASFSKWVGYDTTYHQSTYPENFFSTYNHFIPYLDSKQFDRNGNIIAKEKNTFNEYNQLTSTEIIIYDGEEIASFESASIIHQYSGDNELLKTTTYTSNDPSKNHSLYEEEIYYCHGETIGDFVGVNDKIEFSLEIFPNPTSDFVYIESEEDNINIDVYSLDGHLLKTSNSKNIDLKELKKGVYILKVSSKDLIKSVKIVKD